MAEYRLKRRNGQVLEPLDKDALKAMSRSGKLCNDDEISVVGRDDWRSVSTIPGLAPSVTTAAAIAEFEDDTTAASTRSKSFNYEVEAASPEPQYWYMFGGEVLGPHLLGVLRGRAAAGQILPSTPIAPSPTGPWTSAEENRSLRAAMPRQAWDMEQRPGGSAEITGWILLVLPLLGAIGIYFSGTLGWNESATLAIALGSVVLSSVLIGIDAAILKLGDKTGKERGFFNLNRAGPISWTLGAIVLWVVFYPLYMRWRSNKLERRLGVPALFVTAAFLAAGFVAPPGLPQVDSPEVIRLVEQAMRESAGLKQVVDAGLLQPRLLEPAETSFDMHAQKRTARAQVKTALGTETVHFTVQWHDRRKGIIWVELKAAE